MRILFLTQYYPPEVGAPQNRLHELAVRLKGNGIDVEVLTAMPNYPNMEIHDDYKCNQVKEEIIDGVKVYRSKIYVSKSNSIIKRLLNYFSFVVTSYIKGRGLGYFDYLLVESPPLFLGYSAMALSKKLNSKLIFNVSDLWPESAEKLGLVRNKFFLRLAYKLEEKCYIKSHLITGQTNGIVQSIRSRFPDKEVFWLPNGVDLNFYNPENISSSFRKDNGFSDDDLLLFYGGIIGYAQGLDVILNAALKLKDIHSIKFIVQGSGPEKERLQSKSKDLNLSNVFFFNPVDKKDMPAILLQVDLALVPLRRLELFTGAIPSKIFEALSMKTPLLLGVDGEAKNHFIDKANAGLFFEPENEIDLVAKILHFYNNPSLILEMGSNGRNYVNKHFNRDNISNEFHEKIK